MRNSAYVISAWDGDNLIGLIRALSDGETVAFLHYLLVDPAYQGRHIGDELMRRILKMCIRDSVSTGAVTAGSTVACAAGSFAVIAAIVYLVNIFSVNIFRVCRIMPRQSGDEKDNYSNNEN